MEQEVKKGKERSITQGLDEKLWTAGVQTNQIWAGEKIDVHVYIVFWIILGKIEIMVNRICT